MNANSQRPFPYYGPQAVQEFVVCWTTCKRFFIHTKLGHRWTLFALSIFKENSPKMSIPEHLKLSIEKVLSKSNLEHNEDSFNDLNFWTPNLCFGNPILFWECQNFWSGPKTTFSTEFHLLDHPLNVLAFPKWILDWKFRSFTKVQSSSKFGKAPFLSSMISVSYRFCLFKLGR